jgi:Family of unknown function (DUF6314)
MLKLADFAGHWHFRRRIAALGGIEMVRVEGVIEFAADTHGLVAEERGALRLAGTAAPMAAGRRTLWRPAEGEIAVCFADGRPFHRFDPAAPQPQASHDCPPDRYEVAYDFRAFPLWAARWRVSGPKKQYLMVTLHARETAALAEAATLGQEAEKLLEDWAWQ